MVQLRVFIFILLVASVACGTNQRHLHPVSYPSVGLVCEQTRSVWCEWGNAHCGELQIAIQQVNEVVPNLLIYRGEVPRERLIVMLQDTSQHITGLIQVNDVPAEAYPNLPIAVTSLKLDEWSTDVCLPNVPIAVVWPVQGLSSTDWRQVILHELMHSLGAGHALPDSPFKTVMRPAVSLEHRSGLSMTDKNWLRAVYGQ